MVGADTSVVMQADLVVDRALCTVAIYALRDPRDGEIRYIGKAQDPDARYLQHLRPANLRATTKKNSWLKNLAADGLTPELEIIDWVPAEDADAAEIHWIAWHRMGGCRLTNGTDGGDGFRGKQTAEHRAKIGEALRGRKQTAEARANLSAARTGIKISDEGRKKISDRMRGTLPEHLAAAVADGRLPTGESHHNARLTEDDVREIRRLATAGVSHRELGRRFGVSNVTVGNVVHRRAWRHVD